MEVGHGFRSRKIYQNLKHKHYRDKEAWEKFIDNESRQTRRRLKKQREHETLTDPSSFEFKAY